MIRTMTLKRILRDYRPGSFDRDWKAEFADRGSPARIEEMWGTFTDYLIPNVLRYGWDCVEAVTLGWDKRVWAGHARIFLAHQVGREWLLVDVVEPGERRAGKYGHCAPPEGRWETLTGERS